MQQRSVGRGTYIPAADRKDDLEPRVLGLKADDRRNELAVLRLHAPVHSNGRPSESARVTASAATHMSLNSSSGPQCPPANQQSVVSLRPIRDSAHDSRDEAFGHAQGGAAQ